MKILFHNIARLLKYYKRNINLFLSKKLCELNRLQDIIYKELQSIYFY